MFIKCAIAPALQLLEASKLANGKILEGGASAPKAPDLALLLCMNKLRTNTVSTQTLLAIVSRSEEKSR